MECESEFIVEIDPEWDEDYASHVKLEPVDEDFLDCSREDSYMVNCDDSLNDEHSTVFAVDPNDEHSTVFAVDPNDEHSTVFAVDPNDEHSTVFAVDPEFNCELDNVLPMDHKVRIQSDHNYCTKMPTSSTEMAFESSDSVHPWTEEATTPTTQNDSFSFCCVLCRPSRFSCISLLLKHYLEYHRIQPSSGVQGDLVTHLNLLQRVQKLNTIKIGSTYSIDRNEYYCPCCADTYLDYNRFLQHLTHRTEDCCGRGKDVSARQRPATRTTALADDVTGNDVTTPGNDVTTPGNDVTTAGEDVPTPTGNDVTTPENDVTTTGDDVPTPGNVILPESDVNAARYGVTVSLGEQNLNLFACATCCFVRDSREKMLQHFRCSRHPVKYRSMILGKQEHPAMEHVDTWFGCGVCEAYLSDQKTWIKHLETSGHGLLITAQFATSPCDLHFSHAMYRQVSKCPWCVKTAFQGKAPLFIHLRSVHGVTGFLACEKCGMLVDGTLGNLSQHFQTDCSGDKDISCPLTWHYSCALQLKTFDAFSRHMLQAHSILPFKAPNRSLGKTCKICSGKSHFATGKTLYFTSRCFYQHLAYMHKADVNSVYIASEQSYTPSPYEDHNYCNGLPHSRSKSLKIEKRVSGSMPELEVLDEAAMQESDEEIDVFAPLMMSN